VAKALSILSGTVLLFFGLLRLGWIIEFIPYIPISAFVTAASVTIMSTQLPAVLGITGINTREAPYKVLINTLKGLPRTQMDAAIGITTIVLLFLIRGVCAKMEVRQPSRKKTWTMVSSLRLSFTIFFFTFISFLVHRNTPHTEAKFRIVGPIESGMDGVILPHRWWHTPRGTS
jgi:solute carrier family 26 (sodium-independent sulfate anion transporter), member 11